ncbi:hypothetical protein [Microbacterium sp. NPDC058389]|uniref:hypothetical protein n=1 Tax=Microbacterium sp. NPDC058389 TaxID=3346475 RepID=UPI003652C98E
MSLSISRELGRLSNREAAVLAALPEIAMAGASGATISTPAIPLSASSPTMPPSTPAAVRRDRGIDANGEETSDFGFTATYLRQG